MSSVDPAGRPWCKWAAAVAAPAEGGIIMLHDLEGRWLGTGNSMLLWEGRSRLLMDPPQNSLGLGIGSSKMFAPISDMGTCEQHRWSGPWSLGECLSHDSTGM